MDVGCSEDPTIVPIKMSDSIAVIKLLLRALFNAAIVHVEWDHDCLGFGSMLAVVVRCRLHKGTGKCCLSSGKLSSFESCVE